MHADSIGQFRIERELGRGGMGEVYLARDTRLDRPVAIKALPAHLAQDPDRLARFQREAKVLASLNHPGIGAIYGLEEADGQRYLILEFVDGETLAERLVKGPVPVDEALSIAKQVAEALEAAHEKGVIHRDLKPANIMSTPDGVAKVLDFGLARTDDGALPASAVTVQPDAPTSPARALAHSPTIPGAIMGTAGYMSPEQARGKPVDKRSDIFSFGCVLYEMLSGTMPFRGETVADAIGATLHKESDLSLLPPTTPLRVRELLTNCLAKDRRNRLHDIGDARLELERAVNGREWARTSSDGLGTGSRPFRWGIAAAVGAALLVVGWLVGRSLQHPGSASAAQAFHVSTAVPAKPELNWVVGIAPDARFVVYRASPQLEADSIKPEGVLVVRRLDRDETTVIDGTDGIINAALSADGRWIAFVAARDRAVTKVTLKKIALDGGRPNATAETLCDLPAGWYSLCWSSDREIVLGAVFQKSILAVSAAGGEPRVVLDEGQSKEVDNWSDIHPLVAGKSILACRWALIGQTIKERTEVIDLSTGTRTPLLQNASAGQLVAGGYIVARRDQNSLVAAPLDLNTLQTIGEPVAVWSGGTMNNSFFVSANGTLAMTIKSNDITGRRLVRLDEQGQPQPVGAPPRAYGSIQVSPDGGRVVTALESANDTELPADLWIQDLSRRMLSKVPTSGPSWEFVWSADGQRLAYATVTPDEFSIWERRADGSGEAMKLHSSKSARVMLTPSAWSPDGKVLAILQQDMSTGSEDMLMLERETGGTAWKATPYLNSPASEHALRFSPDGKWVLYCSVESGRHELYAQRFTGATSGPQDAAAGRVQISTNGHDGTSWWSPDGTEIRFIDGDRQVMSVQVQTEPKFSVSPPKMLYSLKELKIRSWAWCPDGRLMAVLEGEGERPDKIDLLVNFADELHAKLATEK